MSGSRSRTSNSKSEGVEDHDAGSRTVRVDTRTIDAQQLAELFPAADARLIAQLQRTLREIVAALPHARHPGLGAALTVAEYALDLALMFALQPATAVLRHERHYLRELVAAWVMVAGDGTEGAVDAANEIGSVGSMAKRTVDRWKADYALAAARNDGAARQTIVALVRHTLSFLLPISSDCIGEKKRNEAIAAGDEDARWNPSLDALVEEALGGPAAVQFKRGSPDDVMGDIFEFAGRTIGDGEGSAGPALARAVRKHRKAVEARLPRAISRR